MGVYLYFGMYTVLQEASGMEGEGLVVHELLRLSAKCSLLLLQVIKFPGVLFIKE